MHITQLAIFSLSLLWGAPPALSTPTPIEQKFYDPHAPIKPSTSAWPKVNPAYSGVFAYPRADLSLVFHRYTTADCTADTHIRHTNNVHSPHCKTFSQPFAAFNYELQSHKPLQDWEALALCQVVVFRHKHCKGDALVTMPNVNSTLGGTREWNLSRKPIIVPGDPASKSAPFCGNTTLLGDGIIGMSVMVLCVRNPNEMLPLGIVKGEFGDVSFTGGTE